jgi:hypothetical protein
METLKPLRVVSVADSALDWLEMAREFSGSEAKCATVIEEYATTREASMVREIPGQKLTWFTIRRLDAAIMDLVLSQENDHMRHRVALKYAVVRIDNLTALSGEQVARLEGEEERRIDGVPVPHLSEKQMAKIAPQYVDEIGGVAFALSFLAPTTAAYFPRPRSWRLLLLTKTSQVVAETDQRFRTDAKRQSQADEDKASSGAPATDAPATGSATADGTPPSTPSAAPSGRRKRPKKRSKK